MPGLNSPIKRPHDQLISWGTFLIFTALKQLKIMTKIEKVCLSDVREDFMARVEKTETCWNWIGTISCWGYPHFKKNGIIVRAHRLSYHLFKGPIPNGLIVRHTCDNRRCVNPEHLLIGTPQDNSNDMVERNRMLVGNDWYNAHKGTIRFGERHPTAKLKEGQVIEIFDLLNRGVPQRKIAKMYGVVQGTIANIKKDGWKHLKPFQQNTGQTG